MGQAKIRGNFEQRQAQGIERREAEENAHRERMLEIERNMTPEEKENRRRARQTLAMISGLAMGAML